MRLEHGAFFAASETESPNDQAKGRASKSYLRISD
jgi:hypothetical protein